MDAYEESYRYEHCDHALRIECELSASTIESFIRIERDRILAKFRDAKVRERWDEIQFEIDGCLAQIETLAQDLVRPPDHDEEPEPTEDELERARNARQG